MEDPNHSSPVPSDTPACDFNESLIDHERTKGLPKGMFVGKDGVVYGFDEEENERELKKLAKTIDREKLRALAKKMKPIRAKIQESDPDF